MLAESSPVLSQRQTRAALDHARSSHDCSSVDKIGQGAEGIPARHLVRVIEAVHELCQEGLEGLQGRSSTVRKTRLETEFGLRRKEWSLTYIEERIIASHCSHSV